MPHKRYSSQQRDSNLDQEGKELKRKAPLLYNSLPPELRGKQQIVAPTKHHIENFKARLNKFLDSVPDVPGIQDNTLISSHTCT